MPDNDALHEARERIAKVKYASLKHVLEDMVHNREQITISRIVELSGLSKSYLYKNVKVKKLISDAKILSVNPAANIDTELSVVPDLNEEDFLIQYEDLKRKLQERYIFESNLISQENKRLKDEISRLETSIEQLQSLPRILVHFVAVGFSEDDYISFMIKSLENDSVYNPVGDDRTIAGFTVGKYLLASNGYSFVLESYKDVANILPNGEDYILAINDGIKDGEIIEIKVLK